MPSFAMVSVRCMPLWLVLAAAAALCWSPCQGQDLAEEDGVAFVVFSNQEVILPVSPIVPQPSVNLRSGSTAIQSIEQKLVAVVAAANRTTIVKTKIAAKEQHLMMRQIFLLCVTMYGTIGCGWIVFWTKRKTADSRLPNRLAAAPEQVDTFYVGLLCLSWASMSVGMHVLNKSLVSYLESPALISGVQMIIAVVIVGGMSGSKIFAVPRGQIWTWMFVPVLFAGMLCSSFYAYAYISLSLLTLIRNLTPLIVLPLESMIMPADKRPVVTMPIVACIFIMLVGAMVYGDGILPSLSMLGLAFAGLNMALAVSDRLLQRRLLTTECKDIPSDVCTIINNSFGLIPTLLLACATHQFEETQTPTNKASWQDPRVLVLLVLSGGVGIGICYLGFMCQRAISATSFFVMQNVSKVAVVSAGVCFFGDPISSRSSVSGLCLSLGGSFLYGYLQMSSSAHAQAAEAPKKQ